MGRIARKGFEYYRAETDRFRDIKIRKLRKEHSCAGYAIYQYVLNEIYRVEGCYIVSIRPRACFFPLFSFLPLWLHYNLNPLCVQY